MYRLIRGLYKYSFILYDRIFFLIQILILSLYKNKLCIVSFYMRNISDDVLIAQSKMVKKYVNKNEQFKFVQLRTGFSHSKSIDIFFRFTRFQFILLLDIDCVPINKNAVSKLLKQVQHSFMAGAAQRASHLNNNDHIYVGPFLMCINTRKYREMGRPSAVETTDGDVAEMLTYTAENLNERITFYYPSFCGQRKWRLTGDMYFGTNTVYENDFLHTFQIRDLPHQVSFVHLIETILSSDVDPLDTIKNFNI